MSLQPLRHPSINREIGSHSRAGNAMARTRTALLLGAREAIAANGVRATSMIDVADYGKVARATLYNHFRSKEELWQALIADEIEQLVELFNEHSALSDGLFAVATYIADHQPLRTIVRLEPEVLARLTTIDDSPQWQAVRSRIGEIARRHKLDDQTAVDLIFRWLLSQVANPLAPEQRVSSAALVARLVKLPAVLF